MDEFDKMHYQVISEICKNIVMRDISSPEEKIKRYKELFDKTKAFYDRLPK